MSVADAVIVARRRTADDVQVLIWSDGAVTGVLGRALPGVSLPRRRSPADTALAVRAAWLVAGDVEVYDASEVPALVRAARKTAAGDGMPGTMRAHAARLLQPRGFRPVFEVRHTDARGVPTERVAHLPRLRWPGLAVLDECTRRPRYSLWTVRPTAPICGFGPVRDTMYPTGFRFATLGELVRHLEAAYPLEARP